MTPRYCIDRAWCDVHGVYLSGWAHWFDRRFDRLSVRCAGREVALELGPRPDVLAAFPAIPADQKVAFEGYLACPPFTPVFLQIGAEDAVLDMKIVLEGDVGPPALPDTGRDFPFQNFQASMKARRGTVLEVGARAVGAESALNAAHFEPECRFIGCDIHPAPGVDLVADVHRLSRAILPGSIDGVFSMVVLEHLAAPWLAAAEINRVLRLGGETLHAAPQAWPVHEQPNDFWRFTDAALRVLFGPATGFEVLSASMLHPVQIVPDIERRGHAAVRLPVSWAYAMSFVYARKVAEIPPGVIAWPLDEALSRQYPVHA